MSTSLCGLCTRGTDGACPVCRETAKPPRATAEQIRRVRQALENTRYYHGVFTLPRLRAWCAAEEARLVARLAAMGASS